MKFKNKILFNWVRSSYGFFKYYIFMLKNCLLKCSFKPKNFYLNPYKKVYVNPAEIKRFSGRERNKASSFKKHGLIMGGEWDISEFPDSRFKELICKNRDGKSYIEESVFFNSIKSFLTGEMKWNENEFVRRMLNTTPNTDWSSYLEEEDIKKKLLQIQNIYFEANRTGMKSAKRFFFNNNEYSFDKIIRNEITVDISRDGEMLLYDGKHRLVIAKIIGLKKIPVLIMVRHKKYIYNENK